MLPLKLRAALGSRQRIVWRGHVMQVVRGGTFQDVFDDVRLANRASVRGSNPQADDIYSEDYLGEFSPKIGFRCASD